MYKFLLCWEVYLICKVVHRVITVSSYILCPIYQKSQIIKGNIASNTEFLFIFSLKISINLHIQSRISRATCTN
jgi:hypothetical protein